MTLDSSGFGQPRSGIAFQQGDKYDLHEVAKGGKTMKTKCFLGFLSVVIFLSGCARMQTATEVNAGRQAYIIWQ
jgi:hypothetical protein